MRRRLHLIALLVAVARVAHGAPIRRDDADRALQGDALDSELAEPEGALGGPTFDLQLGRAHRRRGGEFSLKRDDAVGPPRRVEGGDPVFLPEYRKHPYESPDRVWEVEDDGAGAVNVRRGKSSPSDVLAVVPTAPGRGVAIRPRKIRVGALAQSEGVVRRKVPLTNATLAEMRCRGGVT